MFKNLILALFVVLIMSVPAMATDLTWSSDYAMKDNINMIAGSDNMNGSAGPFIDTIAQTKT